MGNFDTYGKYYDLLYRDKDYKAESQYVIDILNEFKPNSNSLLELGCGSGNHAFFFSEKNYHVTGIERSASMVESANSKVIDNFNVFEDDITTFNLSSSFDVAISLFHVINYLSSNEDVVSCFKQVNKHLNKDGLFLFDIWYSPAVYNQKPETRIKRMEDTDVSILRIAESTMVNERNIVEVNFEVFIENKITGELTKFRELHPMRHFSIPEIQFFASQTGFELIMSEEFQTRKKVSEDTWAICCLLKKISNE